MLLNVVLMILGQGSWLHSPFTDAAVASFKWVWFDGGIFTIGRFGRALWFPFTS